MVWRWSQWLMRRCAADSTPIPAVPVLFVLISHLFSPCAVPAYACSGTDAGCTAARCSRRLKQYKSTSTSSALSTETAYAPKSPECPDIPQATGTPQVTYARRGDVRTTLPYTPKSNPRKRIPALYHTHPRAPYRCQYSASRSCYTLSGTELGCAATGTGEAMLLTVEAGLGQYLLEFTTTEGQCMLCPTSSAALPATLPATLASPLPATLSAPLALRNVRTLTCKRIRKPYNEFTSRVVHVPEYKQLIDPKTEAHDPNNLLGSFEMGFEVGLGWVSVEFENAFSGAEGSRGRGSRVEGRGSRVEG
eukprot:3493096-Rhodomonas_salina.2